MHVNVYVYIYVCVLWLLVLTRVSFHPQLEVFSVSFRFDIAKVVRLC